MSTAVCRRGAAFLSPVRIRAADACVQRLRGPDWAQATVDGRTNATGLPGAAASISWYIIGQAP